MDISGAVLAAVLFGALLHAGWNALVKSSADKALDTALIHGLCSVLGLLMVAVVGWPRAEAWPFVLGSATIHIAYYIALSEAYRHGDLGLTYPLMRGTAPMLVGLSSAVLLGEHLSPLAWAGVSGICCGVLALGLSRQAMDSPRAVGFALLNAVVIAGYTVVDALGARASGAPLQYIAALFAINGWVFALLVVARRGLAQTLPYVRRRWPLALGGAVASIGSYGIALWAMTRAPVATVAALRETSVLFAALLGTWLLREGFTLRRAMGTVTILAGVMALRMA